ncbi:MAG: NAD-dependent epimerase/dehydratase family protein, partial [Sideroxyarcus sp.]|nr:NAD-dependent epimerase/dehydratase family protein [Sideroxyarcus sp.]
MTGATGFLGGHVVRRLVRDGHTVRILRRDTSSLADLQGLLFEDFIGDITTPESVATAMSGVDAVIHAAAKISYWPQDAADTIHVNAYGTQCVANAALEAGAKRFVYVSSVMAVGIPDPGTLGSEALVYNFQTHPNPYSESKHAGELFLQDVAARGLCAMTVN